MNENKEKKRKRHQTEQKSNKKAKENGDQYQLPEGFKLIASDAKKKKLLKNKEVKRLPFWMSIGKLLPEENKPLECLSNLLSSDLLQILTKELNLQSLFPVQHTTIPSILHSVQNGSDVVVCSPTGSGKTLAFALPIIQTLKDLKPRT